MEGTHQDYLKRNNEYFEVFDKNKQIRYGITSRDDKENIEEKYPERYSFEKFDDDYVDVETLEKLSNRINFKQLTFNQMIVLILILLLAISIILGFIFPECPSILKIAVIG